MTVGVLQFRRSAPVRLSRNRAAVYSGPAQWVLHRRQLDDREIRVWEIVLPDSTQGEYLILLDKLDETADGVLPIDWDPDETETVRVRINRMEAKRSSAVGIDILIELEEVIS